MFGSVCAFSQHVALSPDSSRLIFPNTVSITLRPIQGKQFLVSHTALKTILVQCDYLYDRIDQLSETTRLYKREIDIRDSMIYVANNKAGASQERAGLYSDAYVQSKSVSDEYDRQIRSLLADVSNLQKQNRRSRRKSFLKGILSGFACGAVASIIYVSTHD